MSQFEINNLPEEHDGANFTFVVPKPWAVLAACAGRTDLFYDDSDQADAECRLICHFCQVRKHCLDQALVEEAGLSASDRFGMRGGMTPEERATLQRNN